MNGSRPTKRMHERDKRHRHSSAIASPTWSIPCNSGCPVLEKHAGHGDGPRSIMEYQS